MFEGCIFGCVWLFFEGWCDVLFDSVFVWYVDVKGFVVVGVFLCDCGE